MARASSPPLELEQHLGNVRVFVSVADAKGITRASEQIFKATSAVARSIIELERALGLPLFERKSRRMLITAYGEAVLVRARRINDEIQAAADEFLHLTPRNIRVSRSAITNLLFNGRKLELLIRLADLQNISAVAAKMGRSQASASMALSRIEGLLGQPLFQRRVEGMVATEAAEQIVLRARRVLAELRHLSSDLSAIAGYATGSVVIGATHLGRTHYFPTAIASAIAEHPGITVSCVESSYEQLIRQLRSGDIDMVFSLLRPPQLSQGLVTEPLFADRMAIFARTGHPLAGKTGLTIADLLDEKWILPRPNAMGMDQIEDGFRKLGLAPPAPSVQTGDLATLRQLLSATDMLAVASPHQLLYEIQSGLLVELPVRLDDAQMEVGLIVRDGALLSPAALSIIEAVRAQVRGRPDPT